MQQLLPRSAINGRYAYRPAYSLSGFGDAVTAGKNVQIGGAMTAGVATAAVGAIAAHLAATGGSIIGLSAGALSAAVPFIGPALMAAAHAGVKP